MMMTSLFISIVGWFAGFIPPAEPCTATWYSIRYPAAVIQQCNTAARVEGLTEIEKEVVLLTNLVRYDPALFAHHVLRPFIQQCDRSLLFDSSTAAVQSLYTDLANTKPMQVLQVEPLLNQTTASHADYCSRTGHIGHANMTERWQRIKNELGHISAGENCSYVPASKNTALHHVIALLVDADTPSYGHRYAILNKSFQYIGVAVRSFPQDRYCMVQNFSTARNVSE
ncbi:MAG TPA: CAP domain-containing protein [Lacibacter sp.]|nr:CAP domain-containing protein [Lacibacter sp.]HMO90156.1 CAP domain-containing protein [Lacibacter sp.]HMP85835.1 CAP domain-containing protein [Lacibacter sp.]